MSSSSSCLRKEKFQNSWIQQAKNFVSNPKCLVSKRWEAMILVMLYFLYILQFSLVTIFVRAALIWFSTFSREHYVWNSNKESADTWCVAVAQINKGVIHRTAWQFHLDWDVLTFARGEGSGENENEKCKFRRGHRALPTAPIGGGGAGDSSRLFLERETAKTLQSDTFASQVKSTVSG